MWGRNFNNRCVNLCEKLILFNCPAKMEELQSVSILPHKLLQASPTLPPPPPSSSSCGERSAICRKSADVNMQSSASFSSSPQGSVQRAY